MRFLACPFLAACLLPVPAAGTESARPRLVSYAVPTTGLSP